MKLSENKIATTTITVRVKEAAKEQAETILDDIGLTFTGYINASVQALVREKRVPFALVSSEYKMQRMIRTKLEESEVAANDPTAKRYTHDEIFAPFRNKYGYEV